MTVNARERESERARARGCYSSERTRESESEGPLPTLKPDKHGQNHWNLELLRLLATDAIQNNTHEMIYNLHAPITTHALS